MKENKTVHDRSNPLASALLELSSNLTAIKNIADAADYGTELDTKITLIVKLLLPIIDKAQKEKPNQLEIDLMIGNIRYMNQLVIKRKATNPLISSELVGRAADAETIVVGLQKLRNEGTTGQAME